MGNTHGFLPNDNPLLALYRHLLLVNEVASSTESLVSAEPVWSMFRSLTGTLPPEVQPLVSNSIWSFLLLGVSLLRFEPNGSFKQDQRQLLPRDVFWEGVKLLAEETIMYMPANSIAAVVKNGLRPCVSMCPPANVGIIVALWEARIMKESFSDENREFNILANAVLELMKDIFDRIVKPAMQVNRIATLVLKTLSEALPASDDVTTTLLNVDANWHPLAVKFRVALRAMGIIAERQFREKDEQKMAKLAEMLSNCLSGLITRLPIEAGRQLIPGLFSISSHMCVFIEHLVLQAHCLCHL
jgi:hypothetical protein